MWICGCFDRRGADEDRLILFLGNVGAVSGRSIAAMRSRGMRMEISWCAASIIHLRLTHLVLGSYKAHVSIELHLLVLLPRMILSNYNVIVAFLVDLLCFDNYHFFDILKTIYGLIFSFQA